MDNQGLAPIMGGVIYPLEIFKRSGGFGQHAMRSMRKDGLKVIRIGGRAFVSGDDFIAYLNKLEAHENGAGK